MKKYDKGMLLVANPFLKDENFKRTVVLLCEVNNQNATGFILNTKYHKLLNELIEDIDNINFPVYYGGPVQLDSLHFLHKRPDLIEESFHIIDGIYWGGSFENVLHLLKENILTADEIRFYIGYSGWDNDQLVNEFEEKSWFSHVANGNFVFHENCHTHWEETLKDMGGEFARLANYPIDPQLN